MRYLNPENLASGSKKTHFCDHTNASDIEYQMARVHILHTLRFLLPLTLFVLCGPRDDISIYEVFLLQNLTIHYILEMAVLTPLLMSKPAMSKGLAPFTYTVKL